MSERDTYPAGVPCWVEALQSDTDAAHKFYARIFGWQLVGDGEYAVARIRGCDVAGIGALPRPDLPAAWVTHVRVDSADEAAVRAAALGGTVVEPPFDADPAGRMAVLQDPLGALFCVWEAGIREGAQLTNEPSAWAMSALQTPAVARAGEFYGALFGWTTEAFGPVTLFRLSGYVGGTPEQPVPRDVVAVMLDGDAGWGVDFWIADTDAAVSTAAQLGGTVIAAPHDRPPAFRSAVLADPEGAVFSISQLLS